MADLKDKKIAVVGVSEDETKFGHRVFRDLSERDYKVEGVNPKGGAVAGRKLYRSLQELEAKPDLVVTVVPPPVTETIVEQCREMGIGEIWMQPGSESAGAIKKAREYGINITYNTCIMVKNGIW